MWRAFVSIRAGGVKAGEEHLNITFYIEWIHKHLGREASDFPAHYLWSVTFHSDVGWHRQKSPDFMQQFRNLRFEPQGHRSLRPSFSLRSLKAADNSEPAFDLGFTWVSLAAFADSLKAKLV
jgi:hypothetical protein